MAKLPTPYESPLNLPIKIDPRSDTYVIKGGAGVAVAHVKKPNGEVQSMHIRTDGALQQFTRFDPNQISVAERRNLEKSLYQKGMSQSDIADLLGVSQATVSLDLKKLK